MFRFPSSFIYFNFNDKEKSPMHRRSLPLLLLVLAFSLPALAQLPPLIDRELFFGDPEISGSQISPDGRFITFLKPFRGVRNIWVKTRTELFDSARPITADTARPVTSYFWSLDSKYVLYAQDKGGDENYRIYAVDPKAVGDPVPLARDLTPMEKVRAIVIDVPRTTPGEIIVGLNDRRSDLHDVYRLDLSTGARKLIWKNEQNVVGWQTDIEGALRLGLRQTPDGGMEILRVAGDSLVPIYAVNEQEQCFPIRFTLGGNSFYLATNKGAGTDKMQLELFDMKTGTTTLVERDPENEVDFSTAIFSDVSNELLATVYAGDRQRVYPKQKQFAHDWEQMKKVLPPGELSFGSSTLDERISLVGVSSDVDPGSRYLFDRATGKAELLYHARPNLPFADLAPEKPVRYTSRDGLVIPAYLVLPRGVPAENLPVVMLIHGGPWGRDFWGYDPEAQFLANRGYGVLMPNFRGSTGYGKKFLNAGNKQWGTGFMQHDISDGVKYLIAEKIADPKRVAIYGGSYGGYATLAGLAFTPDLYAAGVSYVGPSNIITLLNSIPSYWAPMKKMFDIRVGDMSKPAEKNMLEAQSPLNSASSIRAPLLVVQGANDPRVKKAESDRIVIALRDRGQPVEYLVAPDEGHGFAGRDNRMAFYTAMEKFLASHIGGRFQESVTPEVKKKLDVLTVDVKTVKPPETAPAESAAPPAQFRPSLISAGMQQYTTSFTMAGQKMVMSTVRSIAAAHSERKKIWRVVDVTSGGMGSGTDTVDIDAATGCTLHRAARQGPGMLLLDFSPDGVKGSMNMSGKPTPVDVKFSGELVSDNAGIDVAICTLSLKEGYRATVNMFDSSIWKVRPMVLAVTAREKVTTGAGSFDAYVVDVKPVDGGSGNLKYWITVEHPRVVRNDSEIPESMGGGIVTTELAK
jgi:dipeptidyl aminopeptidase/acylaminoacyl peptidase